MFQLLVSVLQIVLKGTKRHQRRHTVEHVQDRASQSKVHKGKIALRAGTQHKSVISTQSCLFEYIL